MANVIEDKSFDFAVRIVRLTKYLNEQKKRVCTVKAITSLRHKHRSKYRGSPTGAKRCRLSFKDEYLTQRSGGNKVLDSSSESNGLSHGNRIPIYSLGMY